MKRNNQKTKAAKTKKTSKSFEFSKYARKLAARRQIETLRLKRQQDREFTFRVL